MNEPFDLFVFIVLVAVYCVFRISLTLARRTSVKPESAKKPPSHQKQSSPRTRGTQCSDGQRPLPSGRPRWLVSRRRRTLVPPASQANRD